VLVVQQANMDCMVDDLDDALVETLLRPVLLTGEVDGVLMTALL